MRFPRPVGRAIRYAALLTGLAALAACQTTGNRQPKPVNTSVVSVQGTAIPVHLDGNYCIVPDRGGYEDFERKIWRSIQNANRDNRQLLFFIYCDDYRTIQGSAYIQALASEGGIKVALKDGRVLQYSGSLPTYLSAVIRNMDNSDQTESSAKFQERVAENQRNLGIYNSRHLSNVERTRKVDEDAVGAYFRTRYRISAANGAREHVQITGYTMRDGLILRAYVVVVPGTQNEILALDTVKRLIHGIHDSSGTI